MSKTEQKKFFGLAASAGIAFGKICYIDRRRTKIPKRRITESEIENEIKRLLHAIDASDKQLENIETKMSHRDDGEEHIQILQAHRMMLNDKMLINRTKEMITIMLLIYILSTVILYGVCKAYQF